MKIGECLKDWLIEYAGVNESASETQLQEAATKALSSGKLTPEKYRELVAGDCEDDPIEAIADGVAARLSKGPTSREVFGGIRVKGPGEQYRTAKSTAVHIKTGQPVERTKGKYVETPSELELAKFGVFLKSQAARSKAPGANLTEHESDLLASIFEKDSFLVDSGGDEVDVLSGIRTKALLDDVTSGGVYAVPTWFDEMVVTFPLLYGELYPYVNRVDVPASSRIGAVSVDNPTATWGQADGTPVTPFTTDDLIGQITGTVKNIMVAVEIGREILADSPVALGEVLMANMGQRYLEELDDVIANGNGSSEPEGILTASGLGTVTADNGAGGPPTLGDYETAIFSVGKQYRNAALRPAFVGNDTSYARARGLAVSGTDQRRVLGLDEQSYSILQYPYRVQNSIPNTRVAFGALAKYRFWRRLGQQIEITTEGRTLRLANLALLTVRMRCDGKIVDASGWAKWTNGQS